MLECRISLVTSDKNWIKTNENFCVSHISGKTCPYSSNTLQIDLFNLFKYIMETPQPKVLKRTVMEKMKYENTIDIN